MTESSELGQLIASLRELIGRIEQFGVRGKLDHEIAVRRAYRRNRPTDEASLLRLLCAMIAYSQAANSASVTRVLPVIDEMFGDYDPSRVARLSTPTLKNKFWTRLGALRYPTKIESMVSCAEAMVRIEKSGSTLVAMIEESLIPLELVEPAGIVTFWARFQRLQAALKDARMPFFGSLTSLCHLLKDLGYPCMKPDSGVLASAASLGIVPTKRNYNDSDRRVAVETLQRCCIPLRTEMAVLDLYLLINGGMFWARQFVRSDYYA